MAITSTRQLTEKLGDVRRTNNFIVTITDITDNSDLELVIQRAFLPKVSLNVLEMRHGNDAKKFAGVASWEGGQITILDTLQRTELDIVLAWFKSTYDWTTGTVGYAEDYKKIGYISEFAADGRMMRKWPIEGVWISDLDPGELDASQGEMKQVSFTLQIDPSRSFAPTYGKEYDQTPNLNEE